MIWYFDIRDAYLSIAEDLNSLMSEAETTQVGRQFQVLTLVLEKNEYGTV